MVDSSTQSWFRAPLLSKLGVVLGFVCFVAGCKREHISVYTVPKEREAEVDRDIQKVKVAGAEAELFDLVSDKGAAENNKGRVVVAMLPHGGSTWFFKMSGEDESVRAQKPAFLEFLKSVEFRPGHAESPPGRFTSTNVKRVPGGKADTSPGIGARPEWQVPSGWQ